MNLNLNLILPALLSIAISIQAQALTNGALQLVSYETMANAVAKRSNVAVVLSHVEIPLALVGVDFARNIDVNIASSLIFKKSGKKYVRWILNPEDTRWGNELIQHFKAKGLDLKVQQYFIGYQTASRSYIAEDPVSGAQFSVKSSTNMTGGNWSDKKQPVGEAIDGRLISDFLVEQNMKLPFKNFTFMEEPAVLKVEAIDQAIVIRDLGALNSAQNKMIYIPGFSALHDYVGAEIAKRNGSQDPYQFWTDHYVKVAGRALGELAARTGLQFDSPHSQNFLIELNSDYKPTGRLVLRDMSDFYIDTSFIKAIYGPEAKILKNFTQKENMHSHIKAGFGPLHGNIKPAWVDEYKYKIWKRVFFSEFENTFQKTSGYDLGVLNTAKNQYGDYFLASYALDSNEEFKSFFYLLGKEGVVRNTGKALRCQIAHPVGF